MSKQTINFKRPEKTAEAGKKVFEKKFGSELLACFKGRMECFSMQVVTNKCFLRIQHLIENTFDRKRIYANPSSYPNPNTNPNHNPNSNPNPKAQ